ncbi:MAG: 6-bladed beta-propeller [Bacteroidota bacterium]
MKSVLLKYLLIVVLILGSTVSIAQDNIADSTKKNSLKHIRWVSQFPSMEKRKNKKGLFSRLGEFIIGPKPVVLAKPMAIIAINPEDYYVLDQKRVSLAYIKEQKGKNLKPRSKLELPPSSLVGLCELPGKGFLVTDSRNNTIYFIFSDGKSASILNDSLKLNQPTGIAYLESKKEIWVLETKNHQISILNLQGEKVRTIGLRGVSAGEFNYPTHIWIDENEMVYIVDSMNFRIQIFDKDGKWVYMFGEAGDATGYFARPKGIATDSHGNIYVADALFHTIQIFNKAGQLLYNFGKQGREPGDFWMPTGIYIDKNDFIYVADSYNARVQVFQLINHE